MRLAPNTVRLAVRAELVEAHSPFDRLRANELKRTVLGWLLGQQRKSSVSGGVPQSLVEHGECKRRADSCGREARVRLRDGSCRNPLAHMFPLFLRLVVGSMPSTRLAQLTPNPRLVGRHVHDVLVRWYALRGIGARRRHALKDRFFRMGTISATGRLCACTVIVAPASTCRRRWLSRALGSRTPVCMVVT